MKENYKQDYYLIDGQNIHYDDLTDEDKAKAEIDFNNITNPQHELTVQMSASLTFSHTCMVATPEEAIEKAQLAYDAIYGGNDDIQLDDDVQVLDADFNEVEVE